MDDTRNLGFTDAELLEHLPALRRFASRFCRLPNDVDDLVQDTLTKALANAEKFQRGTRLKSWLFTIMRHNFCTKFGLSKREHVGLSEDSALWVSTPATQEWVIRGRELEEALAEMPDHHRLAVTLIFVDGVSYEDAAKKWGCPVGTVKSRVSRARLQLAKMLGEER